jgi:hypothetical protein
MNTKRMLASAVAAVGLAIGLAATAGATAEDDFWECVADHQDTDGIGVCCVFYGGTYDDHGQCWDYPGATVMQQVDPAPKTPPKRPVLTGELHQLPQIGLAPSSP